MKAISLAAVCFNISVSTPPEWRWLPPIFAHNFQHLGANHSISPALTKVVKFIALDLGKVAAINMSIVCPNCGRADFKSQRGLKLHLRNSQSCNIIAQQNAKQSGQKRKGLSERLEHQSDESSLSDGYADNQDDDIEMHAEEDSACEIINQQDDDSWGLGDFEHHGEPTNITAAEKHLYQFKAYIKQNRDHTIPFDRHEVAAIELLDVLIKKKASLDTYDAIMEWRLNNWPKNVPPPRRVNRDTLLAKLATRYNMPTKVVRTPTGLEKHEIELVKKKTIVLPSSNAKVDIIYNDVRDLMVSLLTDPRLTDDDFLHFDNDPLAPPPENQTFLGDINTGRAYRETYNKLITKPGKQMLVPVIFYIDGAVTGQFDKLQVEALTFSLGIFTKAARALLKCWRKVGLVPNWSPADSRGKKILQESKHAAAHLLPTEEDEGRSGSSSDSSDSSDDGEHLSGSKVYRHGAQYELTDEKAQDYHAILAALLETYKELERDGMTWDYKYRGKVYKNIELVFFVPTIMADTAEADKHCSKHGSRGHRVSQLCRYCTIRTDQSDSHFLPRSVKLKTAPAIARLVELRRLAALKDLSQSDIVNAWHSVRFGQHSKQGVHGACPMEMLHHILLGIFKHARDCFLIQVGKSSKAAQEVNALSKLLGKMIARQSERDMPKTNFSNGVFGKGKIMGKEFSGVLLVILAVLHTKAGRDALKSARSGRFKNRDLVDDWILLLELLLEWEEFLKLDTMERDLVVRMKRKHKFLMYLFKRVCRRTEGMGFKVVKYHAILHMVDDILNFGVPSGLDTGFVESHHKVTKVAAKCTQRNITVFEHQTAIRLMEFFLVELAMAELDGMVAWEYFCLDQRAPPKDHSGDNNSPAPVTKGATLSVFRDEQTGTVEWCYTNTPNKPGGWEMSITKFLAELQDAAAAMQVPSLKIRTEHKRNGNQIFRGDPNYRCSGQWNDWAEFDWGREHGKLAGEIWCFVDFRDQTEQFQLDFAGCRVTNSVYAVVESSYECPNLSKLGDRLINESEMFQPILKEIADVDRDRDIVERRFYLADVESIVKPLCVIPDVGSNQIGRYLIVKPRCEWSKLFAKWLSDPYKDDEDQMSDQEGMDDN